jgi:hypothetical protein
MDYGGHLNGSFCGASCDGMPIASDPDWKIVDDAFGCPRWTNPHDGFNGGAFSDETSYCGGEVRNDAGSSDASDASDAAD